MVEIAISLGIIAFALVAIIGVLPMGMNVQRENRQQTLVNQDGTYFLEAIRNGAKGLDYLTQHVEWITIAKTGSGGTDTQIYYNPATGFDPPVKPSFNGENKLMIDGNWIIGLLSTPKYTLNTNGEVLTNKVLAYVHALSGNALEQGTNSRELSFAYLLTSEVVPFTSSSPGNSMRTNLVSGLADSKANLYDVRLTFRWPVSPNGDLPPVIKRQQFRALVSSIETNLLPLYFFVPQQFQKVTP